MPVIVVGADTPPGRRIVESFAHPVRDVRAFVSNPGVVSGLRRLGIKVAVGDVSDESHIQAAASGCFTAILVAEAADDHRIRSFASDRQEVLNAWARGLAASHVRRVIWVGEGDHPRVPGAEIAQVSPGRDDLESAVVRLDEAESIGPRRSG